MCIKDGWRPSFRDLEAFNLALLAKQWWKLIHNEESLSFKVFKVRYFHLNNPSEVELAQKNILYLVRSDKRERGCEWWS